MAASDLSHNLLTWRQVVPLEEVMATAKAQLFEIIAARSVLFSSLLLSSLRLSDTTIYEP